MILFAVFHAPSRQQVAYFGFFKYPWLHCSPRQHLVPHVTPLGWEHITLTGDYIWVTVTRQASNL